MSNTIVTAPWLEFPGPELIVPCWPVAGFLRQAPPYTKLCKIMAITNNERIKKTLDLLREGLQPFVERRLKAAWGAR